MKNAITKALVNADALDQKISAATTQTEAMLSNVKRVTCLDDFGRDIACAIIERQAHETVTILEKALADVERLEAQLRGMIETQADRESDLVENIKRGLSEVVSW